MMRYKLYKHKKQWVIGCTVLIMATMTGMKSSQASTTINNANVAPPATSLAQTTQSTNNGEQAANVPVNQSTPITSGQQSEHHPQSVERWQFVATNNEGRQVFAEPIQQNNTQTDTQRLTPIAVPSTLAFRA